MRTWTIEVVLVAGVLVGTLAATGRLAHQAEWVGALAVLLTFCHVQVADRLAEAERARAEAQASEAREKILTPAELTKAEEAVRHLGHHVECHAWARRYLVSKELCWLVYFTLLGAYSALVGVGVFLAYPVWRAWYKRRG